VGKLASVTPYCYQTQPTGKSFPCQQKSLKSSTYRVCSLNYYDLRQRFARCPQNGMVGPDGAPRSSWSFLLRRIHNQRRRKRFWGHFPEFLIRAVFAVCFPLKTYKRKAATPNRLLVNITWHRTLQNPILWLWKIFSNFSSKLKTRRSF
jgi:hypothetical protein